MSDYPINIRTKGITGRDGYIIAEAMVLALKYLDASPDPNQPNIDRRQIIEILNAVFPDWEDTFGPG
jgi:hypothetical protein